MPPLSGLVGGARRSSSRPASSDAIRFVAGATRTVTPELEAFAKKHGFRLLPNYEAVLAERDVAAVVLATPHSMHGAQVMPQPRQRTNMCSAKSRSR